MSISSYMIRLASGSIIARAGEFFFSFAGRLISLALLPDTFIQYIYTNMYLHVYTVRVFHGACSRHSLCIYFYIYRRQDNKEAKCRQKITYSSVGWTFLLQI